MRKLTTQRGQLNRIQKNAEKDIFKNQITDVNQLTREISRTEKVYKTLNNRLRTGRALTQQQADQLRNASNRLKVLRAEAREAGVNIQTLGTRFNFLEKTLLRIGVLFAGAQIFRGLRGIVDFTRNFEDTLISVQKTTDFTAEEIDQFGDSVFKLGRTTGVAVDSLAEIGVVAGQLGVGAEGVEAVTSFTEVIGKATVALSEYNGNSEEVATQVAKQLNAFGLTTAAAESYLSSINELTNTTAANAVEISSFNRNFAGTARTIGITFQEANALGATLVSLGTAGDDAGTRLSSAFDFALKNIDKIAESTSLTEEQLSTLFNNTPVEGLLTVVSELNQIGDQVERNKVLVDIFGRVGGRVARQLANAQERYSDNLQTSADAAVILADSQSSIEREFQKANQSFNAELTRTLNVLKEFSNQIGQVFLPVLATGLRFIQDFITSTSSAFTALRSVLAGLAAAGAFIAGSGIIGSLGGAALGFGAIAKAIGVLLPLLTGPAGIAFALGAVITFIVQAVQAQEEWRVSSNSVLRAIANLVGTVSTVFERLSQTIDSVTRSIVALLPQMDNATKRSLTLTKFIQGITFAFTALVEGFRVGIVVVVESIGSLVNSFRILGAVGGATMVGIVEASRTFKTAFSANIELGIQTAVGIFRDFRLRAAELLNGIAGIEIDTTDLKKDVDDALAENARLQRESNAARDAFSNSFSDSFGAALAQSEGIQEAVDGLNGSLSRVSGTAESALGNLESSFRDLADLPDISQAIGADKPIQVPVEAVPPSGNNQSFNPLDDDAEKSAKAKARSVSDAIKEAFENNSEFTQEAVSLTDSYEKSLESVEKRLETAAEAQRKFNAEQALLAERGREDIDEFNNDSIRDFVFFIEERKEEIEELRERLSETQDRAARITINEEIEALNAEVAKARAFLNEFKADTDNSEGDSISDQIAALEDQRIRANSFAERSYYQSEIERLEELRQKEGERDQERLDSIRAQIRATERALNNPAGQDEATTNRLLERLADLRSQIEPQGIAGADDAEARALEEFNQTESEKLQTKVKNEQAFLQERQTILEAETLAELQALNNIKDRKNQDLLSEKISQLQSIQEQRTAALESQAQVHEDFLTKITNATEYRKEKEQEYADFAIGQARRVEEAYRRARAQAGGSLPAPNNGSFHTGGMADFASKAQKSLARRMGYGRKEIPGVTLLKGERVLNPSETRAYNKAKNAKPDFSKLNRALAQQRPSVSNSNQSSRNFNKRVNIGGINVYNPIQQTPAEIKRFTKNWY